MRCWRKEVSRRCGALLILRAKDKEDEILNHTAGAGKLEGGLAADLRILVGRLPLNTEGRKPLLSRCFFDGPYP